MTSMVKPEGRRIIHISPLRATLAGFLAIAAFGLTAEPFPKTLTFAPEIANAQDVSAAFITQFVVATDTPTPTATMTHTPTTLPTMTSSPTPSRTATNPALTPTKKSPDKISVPVKSPTAQPTAETAKSQTKELTNATAAEINVGLGELVNMVFQVYDGATQLIFSSTNGVRLPDGQMQVFSPERWADRNSGGDQKPTGTGNSCPSALKAKHGDCTIYQGGHWSMEPAKNKWEVVIVGPAQGKIFLDNSQGGETGENCFSYWENYSNGARVFWTECNRSQ